MSYTLETIIQEATDFEPSESKPHLAVAISGGSATGKSTLTNLVLESLGDKAVVVSLDDYQLDGKYEGFDTSIYRYDDPRNFQLQRVAQDLRTLLSGGSIQAPRFRVGTGIAEGTNIVESAPVILVDGLYAANTQLASLMNRKVYVESPLFGRFIRRLFRLEHEYRVANSETALRHSFGPTLAAHRRYVIPQRSTTDLIVNNKYSFPESVEKYNLKPLVDQSLLTSVLWQNDALVFRLGELSAKKLFQLCYKGKVYSQFNIEDTNVELLKSAVGSFEEL
ncbi:MAG: hypothetical protein ABI220_02910 [Candidatus Saccharimonadales bacterium]